MVGVLPNIINNIGADSTGARGIFAPLLFKVGGQEYHLAPLDFSGNFNINVYLASINYLETTVY